MLRWASSTLPTVAPSYLKGNVGAIHLPAVRKGAMVWDAVLRTAIYPYA